MNTILKMVKSIALTALALAPGLASAEKLQKHTDSEGWEEWYWTKSVSVKVGEAHTFWITGLTESTAVSGMEVYCDYTYKEDGETYEDSVVASKLEEIKNSSGGYDLYVVLATEDWEDYYGSKSSLSFTVRVDGDGEDASTADISFNFGHASGDVIPETYGTEDNPQPITVGSSIASSSGSLFEDGSFYFKATLEAGRKYKFYTSGGTEDESLSLDVYTDPEATEEMDAPELKDIDVGENDEGYIVKPASTGVHIIKVDGYEENQSFTLNYGGVPSRLPKDHDFEDLGAISAAGVTTELELGHRNDPESGYFDSVIDQSLVKVTLAAGAMYRFATKGAAVNAIMEVYDAKGTVLQTNRGGVGSADCEMTFKPSTKGDYFVGVCEELEDDEEDEPSWETVDFTAKLVTLDDGFKDASDPEDDTYLGSTGLAPSIGTVGSDVLTDGESAGSHTLGIGDLADWFRIDARKGLGYKIGAVLGEPYASASNLVLQAKVYTLKSGKLTAFTVTSKDDDLTQGISFTAADNASYYIEVTVRDGVGIDFGPYEFKSLAYDPQGGKLGTLTVKIGGATFAEGAVWQLGNEKVTYPGDASLQLPEGSYTVNFATVKNWTAPSAQTATVDADVPEVVDVKYSDTADHKDDVITGATKLTLSTKEATVSRSLWTDDPADWFSFAVKPSGYYTFKLESTSKLGDARIYVYASDKTSLVAEGTSVNFLCRDTKGDYYVKVAHGASPVVDSQYVMTYSMKQVGTVGFAKTALSVKDSATTVALTVNRANGKDGKVRVRYSTFAGTAEPGKNYINQSGILEWAENDAKAKTVTITLLGDLVAAWHEDLVFTVQLAALDPEDVTADEYVPMIGASTATVTISAATKKSTGTVQFCGFGEQNEAFANVKKPTATIKSGEKAYFWLERTGGSDGTVAVTVTPTKGKALPDVNYVDEPVTLVWADGETEAKCFTLETLVEDVELQSAKAMTLKLVADKTTYADTAKVGVAATLTISDSKVATTVEEYAATFAKTDGIAIKQGKTDTWYFDAAGTLRSITPAAGAKAELTVTLTGPGKFAFTPTVVNNCSAKSTVTCTVGKETISLTEGEEIVRYIAKGSTTVKFAVSRDKSDKSDDAECYLALDSGKADGSPFVWKQLKTPTLVAPLAGSIVDPLTETEIEWSDVDTTGDGDVIYRVWFDTEKNKSKLGTSDPLQESAETSYCTGCGMVTPGYGESWVCRVDSAFVDEEGNVMLTAVNSSVWSYKTIPAKGAVTTVLTSGTDVDGNAIAELEKVGNAYPVKLLQGVAADIRLGAENASGTTACTYSLATGSKLPDGLKLDSKTGRITGAPTKVGEYQTVIGVKQGKISGGTEAFVFTVEAAGLATGTFNGLVSSDDDRLVWTDDGDWNTLASSKIGSIAFTSTDAGKLTAKLTVGATAYTFTDNNGWDGKDLLDNGLDGVTNVFASVVNFTVSGKKVVCTNRLVVAACAATDEDGFWEAHDTALKAELTLSFLSADKKSVIRDVAYTGTACRDNVKETATLAELADWAGYYTISLPCSGYAQFVQGYGYLTMTIDAKGKAKVTGVLADGSTKLSASASVAYLSENDKGDREARIPLYYGKGTISFGGWLRLKLEEDGTPVVDSDSDLFWINASTSASYGGTEGFDIEIEPTGGYYDTVMNLQTYYLDYAFRVNAVDTDDLPEELLGANEQYVCAPGMYGEYLTLLGSNITMDKQVKVMRTDNKKLIDWKNTVNPSALTMTFKRATGIYNGQFELWAGNADAGEETKQTKLGTFKHQGVLLLSRDESAGELAFDDGVMPGFWNATVSIQDEGTTKKRSFTASLPFVIAPEARENDWTEELPRTEAEEVE